MKDLAPSTELRQWFAHDPTKWPAFQRRYRRELRTHSESVRRLASLARRGRVTLVYASRRRRRSDFTCARIEETALSTRGGGRRLAPSPRGGTRSDAYKKCSSWCSIARTSRRSIPLFRFQKRSSTTSERPGCRADIVVRYPGRHRPTVRISYAVKRRATDSRRPLSHPQIFDE